MGVMKTPGVYIVEKNAFPNSVVEVATAVPAFIGYTEKADNKGKPLLNTPWRISSMAEFHLYFGGAPVAKFKIDERSSEVLAKTADAPVDTDVASKTLILAKALSALAKAELDFANAEVTRITADASAPGDFSVVTAKQGEVEGARKDLKASKDSAEARATEAREGTDKHAANALATSNAKAAADIAQKKSDAAQKLETDLTATPSDSKLLATVTQPPPDDIVAIVAIVSDDPTAFKLDGKEYLLTRLSGANGGCFLLYYGMQQFFQNGGGPCYVVSVGDYNNDVEEAKLSAGIALLIKEQEPTMLVLPDCMMLKVADCISVQQNALMHCGNVMRNRVAILDVWGGYRALNENPIADFRDKLGINCLDFAAAYYPWLHTTVVQDNDLSYANIDNLANLQSLLKIELKLPTDPAAATVSSKDKAQSQTVADIANSSADWAGAAGDDVKLKTDQERAEYARMQSQLLNKSLLAISPMFNNVLAEVKKRLNLLPPSAAMAGIYTMVDNTRGVWKAPANVSLNGVISPAVSLSAADQEDLNVTTQGKSINAIRSFIGEGVLVWGARTLDGNSLDWRYISVRRTMIMLEESCRLAAKAMVFEPNVANTWVTIKSMIQNFLTGIWKRGGLAGAVPDDAFSVHVGLGETMSAEDILEGILRVTVLVAISHPAEFIEITFQQQLQKS